LILDDALIFKTLFNGFYSRDDVDILWQPSPLSLPEVMNEEIEHHWQTLSKEYIFNGSLARLEHWAATPVHCQFVLRPSNYQTLLYSNHHVQHIKEKWGFQYLSRALGVSAVMVSADNRLLLMKRSAFVGESPNCYDLFGGHVDIAENGTPCVFRAMAQELQEEVGLEPDDHDLSLLGLIETTATKKPELVFQAKTTKTANEIIAAAKNAKDNLEFSNIFSILNRLEDIQHFLKEHCKEFSPSAFGSLCVHMQTNFADEE